MLGGMFEKIGENPFGKPFSLYEDCAWGVIENIKKKGESNLKNDVNYLSPPTYVFTEYSTSFEHDQNPLVLCLLNPAITIIAT